MFDKSMKILIIRFSSIGDVLQSLSLIDVVRKKNPMAQVDFLTQKQFEEFFVTHPGLHRCFYVPKKSGLREIWAISKELKNQGYTHVYDAHNNLRSRLVCWCLRLRGARFQFLRRSIQRWKRWMLFRFRIHLFPKPFSGQMDMIRPLKKWGMDGQVPSQPSLYIQESVIQNARLKLGSWADKKFITLAPSAAYPLKRWPLEYWSELIQISTDQHFVLLGGSEDQFLSELSVQYPSRVLNLAGQLSLAESAAVVGLSQILISNDTGVMHMAEQQNHPCVALMGPAPFGFPSKPSTRVLERELWCRPCSKHGQGPCINKEFQKCLRDISPTEVFQTVGKIGKKIGERTGVL